MRKLLPVLLLLTGTGAGVGAGVYLRPSPELSEDVEMTKDQTETAEKDAASEEKKASFGKEYIKLSNQFVVPIVEKDRIASMVVMTLSVEVPEGRGEDVYDLEPKIRDVFLRVLFDHAAIGGFAGAFLNNDNLDAVRSALGHAASTDFGSDFISDVLIFEIARQDY